MDVTCTIVMLVWRPEFGMEWKWTPVQCLRGVQNWDWSENGRQCYVGVASRIGGGVEMDATVKSVWRPESGMEWKWTPVPSSCGVQNRGWSESGRHCHVCVASRIGNGVEVDATVKSVWRPESGMKREWTPPPSHLASSAKIAAIPDAFLSAPDTFPPIPDAFSSAASVY